MLCSGCANIYYNEYNISDSLYAIEINIELDNEAGKGTIPLNKIKYDITTVCNNNISAISLKYATNLNLLKANGTLDQEACDLLSSKNAFSVNGEWLGNTYSLAFIIREVSNQNYHFTTSQIINIYAYGSLTNPNSDASENSNIQLKERLFTTIVTQTITTPFSDSECELYETLFMNDLGYSQEYTLNDTNYIYTYITNLRRIHSDGKVTYTDNGYSHTWKLEKDQNGKIINDNIILYRIYTNGIPWYILALVIGFFSFIILIVIFYIKNKKNKSKKPEIINI